VPLLSLLYTCPPIASVIVLLLPTMNGGLSGMLRDLLREALLALVCPALSSCRRFLRRCTTTRLPLIMLGATIRKLFSRFGRDRMLVIIFAGIVSMITGSLERMWQVIRPWCTIDDYLSVLMHQSTVTFEV
jgi:chromate transport protein ChrA